MINVAPTFSPPIGILREGPVVTFSRDLINRWMVAIEETLAIFGIDASLEGQTIGPRIVQFQLCPAPGVRVKRIMQIENELAIALGQIVRVVLIPGAQFVAIEVARPVAQPVTLREVLEHPADVTGALPVQIGMGVDGETVGFDLAKAPHLLIAGSTGSGKSVAINALLCSLLLTQHPSRLKLLLVDPKRVELTPYEEVPHLLRPVVTSPPQVIALLNWTVHEMERRYELLESVGVRQLSEYNARPGLFLPYIVLVIDELADLILSSKKVVETPLVRLAQMARAVGIHLVVATQRPSVNVITGLIKANFPSRMAFTVAQRVNSGVILDQSGAEKLLGAGDMLFVGPGENTPRRVQGAFVSSTDIDRVANFWQIAQQFA